MASVYKLVNATGTGGGGGDATPYQQSFDATTSWGAASGGEYSIVIPQSTHNKNTTPFVQVYADIGGGNFEEVEVAIEINAAGDVSLIVTENIDTRFAGKVIIL